MSAEPWGEVTALLDGAVRAGLFAGCALCVTTREGEALAVQRGQAELRPRARALRPDHPFDVASLTKVLCTTPLALALADAGRLDLDGPAADWLPGADPRITARALLHHGSGLPAWNRIYAEVEETGLAWGSPAARAFAMRAAWTTPLEAEPMARHRYSDLGFLTLGALLEAAGGDRIDRLWERHVRRPAGVDLRWGWPDAAATEDCPVRGRVVVGEVHDLNAATMGGIAPHAGLFGSARAVAALAGWQLAAWQGQLVGGPSPERMRAAWSAEGPGSHRLGWDGVTAGASSAGPRWPLDGVGHLGFTGCSVWVAPRQGVVVAFLSNRVHPEIEGGAVPDAPEAARYAAFRRLRPALHTAIVDALDGLGCWDPDAPAP